MIQHISQSHIREPGIAEALYRILMSAGLITPDGRMMMPGPGPAASGVITTDDAATGSGNKVWTPDGDSSGEKKSKLWVPE